MGAGGGGVEAETPADFIGHPVSDAGAGVLVEEEGFEGFFRVSFYKFTDMGEGEFGVLWLGGELGPGVFTVVEHDAAEHTVVIKDEGGVCVAVRA